MSRVQPAGELAFQVFQFQAQPPMMPMEPARGCAFADACGVIIHGMKVWYSRVWGELTIPSVSVIINDSNEAFFVQLKYDDNVPRGTS